MSKTETSVAGKKAAYTGPNIVCSLVEYSLCAESLSDGGHKNAEPDLGPLEPEDGERRQVGNS